MDWFVCEVIKAFEITCSEQLIYMIKSSNNHVHAEYKSRSYFLEYDHVIRKFSLSGGKFSTPVTGVCPFSDCKHGDCSPRLADFVSKFIPSELFVPPFAFYPLRNEDLRWAVEKMYNEGILRRGASLDELRSQIFQHILCNGPVTMRSMVFMITEVNPGNIRFQDVREAIKASLCHNFPICLERGNTKRSDVLFCDDCLKEVPKDVYSVPESRQRALMWMKKSFNLAADLICSPHIPDFSTPEAIYGWTHVIEKLKKIGDAGYSFFFDHRWVKVFINPSGQLCFEFLIEETEQTKVFKACLSSCCFEEPQPESLYCINHLNSNSLSNDNKEAKNVNELITMFKKF